jgi:ribosomal-protein-alanine N-acetyltransferase
LAETEQVKPIPFLKGERIDLVVPRSEWVDIRARWVNNPKIRTYLRGPLPSTKDQMKQRFERVREGGLGEWVGFVVYHKADNKPIGEVGLSRINWFDGWANAYANIGETEYWNQNYATEAVELLLKYAFEELNLNKISGSVALPNKGSWSVAEKLNFRFEGSSMEDSYRDGRYLNVKHYCYLQKDWLNRKN